MPQVPPITLLCAHTPLLGVQLSVVHTLLSSQFFMVPGVQLLFLQTSVMVHALPSSQPALLAVCVQPFLGSQASSVQGLPSLQSGALRPAMQTPLLHASPAVHTLPSASQIAVSLLLLSKMHEPVLAWHASLVQTFPSSQTFLLPGKHVPPLQMSPMVQPLSSALHGETLVVCVQPVGGSQTSSVQGLPSVQSTSVPAVQTPSLQVSPTVHTLPSASQGLSWLASSGLQLPLTGSQMLTVHALPVPPQVTMVPGLMAQTPVPVDLSQKSVPLQKLPSSWLAHSPSLMHPHVLLPPTQVPRLHVSPLVQSLPSSQLTALLVWAQPLAGRHASLVQALLSSQSVAALAMPAQLPPLQVSKSVQAFPSSQAEVLGVLTQPVKGAHEPLVHGLPSLQSTPCPMHKPFAQLSLVVHRLPSSHGLVVLAWLQAPVLASQPSTVQGLLSSQFVGVPALHRPATQVSPTVHALPSSQLSAWAVWVQPLARSQASAVQGLASLQSTGLPTQNPSLQPSLSVHAVPSLQAKPSDWLR